MQNVKIDETRIQFWNHLEIKIKIGTREISWTGWRAIIMHELMISGAAMTKEGAIDLVLDVGKIDVDPKKVRRFIEEMLKDGLINMHYEKNSKTGKRRRIYMSALQFGRFILEKKMLEEEQ